MPGRTAVDMETAAIAELAKHPKIVGLKDVRGPFCCAAWLRALYFGTRVLAEPASRLNVPDVSRGPFIKLLQPFPINDR